MGTTWIMFSNGLGINSNDARNRVHSCIRLLYRIGSGYSEAIRMKKYNLAEILKAWEEAFGEDMFIEYPGFIQRLTEQNSKERWEENENKS